MCVDELVDDGLAGGIDLLELDTHADAAVAPGDAPFHVDVLLGTRHAEPDLDLRSAFERARRPDRNAAVAQVERERRRDRVAEPVLSRDAEHDPRAAAAVEAVGKEVR